MKPSGAATTQDSALARHRLLTAALAGAKDVPKALREGCKTQASFAALTISSHGIAKLALNTLKASADASIEIGGWETLDDMRRQYRQSLKTVKKEQSDGPPTLSADEALALERRVRIRLETAYLDLLIQLAKLAEGDPQIGDFLKRHQAGFRIERMKAFAGGRRDE